MKTVFLIRNFAPLFYIPNYVQKYFDVECVIIEGGVGRTFYEKIIRNYRKLRKHGIINYFESRNESIKIKRWLRENYISNTESMYDKYLTEADPCTLDAHLPRYNVKPNAINEDATEKYLSAVQPDLLIVFGTQIIKENILKIPKLGSINIHTGLSPYYRGTHCIEWAILNDEIDKIGATLHFLDKNIDTGEIIKTVIPKIEKSDNHITLYLKLVNCCATSLVDILRDISSGREIQSIAQDLGKGKTYFLKDWSLDKYKMLIEKEKMFFN